MIVNVLALLNILENEGQLVRNLKQPKESKQEKEMNDKWSIMKFEKAGHLPFIVQKIDTIVIRYTHVKLPP